MPKPPFIKAMTRREIAHLLGMEEHTFARKLKNKGIELPKGLVAPQWQKAFLMPFGIRLPIEGKTLMPLDSEACSVLFKKAQPCSVLLNPGFG